MSPVGPTAAAAFERARRVADAVLYEGYVLYPYRASSGKNRARWQFGVLAPRPFAEADGSERWSATAGIVAETGAEATLDVTVRFLHVQSRSASADGTAPAWDEAVEREVELTGVDLWAPGAHEVAVTLPAAVEEGDGVTRSRQPVDGRVVVTVGDVPGPWPLATVHVAVENLTPWCDTGVHRDDVVRRSFVGVHALLHVDDGGFFSPRDAPEFATPAVRSCTNDGLWPVLVGEEGDRSTVLASPIILDDHPQVAPESPGDMCDATEIDEILALRVLTLTDEEKVEARATDERAAAILDRVDAFPPEVFERLHGAVRALRPAAATEEALPWWEPAVDAAVNPWEDTVRVGGTEVGRGAKVTLRPGRRADAQDLFLAGRPATVEGVFTDVDGGCQVAVVLDDDPGADLYAAQGRYLFFHPEEVEPR